MISKIHKFFFLACFVAAMPLAGDPASAGNAKDKVVRKTITEITEAARDINKQKKRIPDPDGPRTPPRVLAPRIPGQISNPPGHVGGNVPSATSGLPGDAEIAGLVDDFLSGVGRGGNPTKPAAIEVPPNTLTADQFRNAVDEARKRRPDKFSSPKILDVVYRVDSRTPEEIAKAGGFYPNPNKPDGDLIQHTELGVPGTSRFVSTTTKEANPTLILGTDFPKNRTNWSETEVLRIVNKKWPDEAPLPDPVRYIVYEYRAHNVEATVLTAKVYADEAEAVVRALPSSGSGGLEARVITIEVPWQKRKPDDWVEGESVWIQPGNIQRDGKISIGPWSPVQ